MAALPENWEWDYDGKRWFYRYKPTGLIQYTFPKPGDEFPEFVDEGSSRFDLAPEEKLVSQKQVKRRSTLGESSSKKPTGAARKESPAAASIAEQDDGGSPFWLQPDGLMYMGPGAYTDISPLQEEDDEEEVEKAGQETKEVGESKDTVTTDLATTRPESPKHDTTQLVRSHISPIVSTETTPLVTNSQPAITSPEVSSVIIVETGQDAPADVGTAPSPTVPLLDSRQIEAPYDPLGVVAELPSELTAQCYEETHPAPVELPSNEMMIDVAEPVVYANAFPLDPVELPSDTVSAPRIPAGTRAAQKASTSQVLPHGEAQSRVSQAVHDHVHRPYRPAQQNSPPQPANDPVKSSDANREPIPGKYQPYNPAKPAVEAGYTSTPASSHRYSIAGIQDHELVSGNKRHSLAGPAPPGYRPSDIPAVLKPPQVPPKQPLDGAGNGEQAATRVSRTRHESISGPGPANNSGLAKFPSVLQPARGRIPTRSPPRNRQDSPNKDYQAYKPYRDLQQDIEETVQLLSKTGYGQATTLPDTAGQGRPQSARTGTLPADLPAIPFMGVRPQLPHSAASAPATLQGLQSHQTPPHGHGSSIAPGREASTAAFQVYSTPLPPSSPDLPEPLNLSRKSPVPAAQNSIPTVTTSLRPPVSTGSEMVSREPTPIPYEIMNVSAPGPADAATEPDAARGSLGSMGEINVHGQAELVGQPSQLDSSGIPQFGPFEMQADKVYVAAVPSDSDPQNKPSETTIHGETSVMEPSVFAAPQPAAPTQTQPVKSEFNAPTSTDSLKVEVIDNPAALERAAECSEQQRHAAPIGAAPPRDQEIQDKQQTMPSPSETPLRETSQPSCPRPNPTPSSPTPVASSAHIILDYSLVETQPHPQAMSKKNTVPSSDQPVQGGTSGPPHASPAAPRTSGRQPSLDSPGLVAQHAVTPSPQPSLLSRAPRPRSPSPVSRAPSPPLHVSTPEAQSSSRSQKLVVQVQRHQQLDSPNSGQRPALAGDTVSSSMSLSTTDQSFAHHQTCVPQTNVLVGPPAAAVAGSVQEAAPATQPSIEQGSVYSPATGLKPSPMPPQPLVSHSPTNRTAPTQPLPAGQRPLASQPVDVSPPTPAAGTKLGNLRSDSLSENQTPSLAAPRAVVPAVRAQNSSTSGSPTSDFSATGTSSQQTSQAQPEHTSSQPMAGPSQGGPMPIPPSLLAQQGPTSPPGSMSSIGHRGSQPPMPQFLPMAGTVQLPMQAAGQMQAMPVAPGQPHPMSNPPGQLYAHAPHRSLSLMSPMPSAPHTIGTPGTAPQHQPMAFAPQGVHQGMPPSQALQPGMLPPRQTFPLQPGMATHQPVPPQMMYANQTTGGPHAMQTQPPHAAAQAKEEKSWFGRLWRSDTVKRSSSVAGGNKLQKQGGRPLPQQPYMQGQVHPMAQLVGQPILAPGIAPQMMMHRPAQHVQQQPQPQLQPPPQFQQQQQQQQQQPQPRQMQMQRQSMSGGPAAGGMSAQVVQQVQRQGPAGGQYSVAGGGSHGGGGAPGVPGAGMGNTKAASSSTGWGNSSTYDGSGWGDFEEDDR